MNRSSFRSEKGRRHRGSSGSGSRRLLGNRIAFYTGIGLALGLLGFFSWKFTTLIERDRGLAAVPYSTPTPPPPPPRR